MVDIDCSIEHRLVFRVLEEVEIHYIPIVLLGKIEHLECFSALAAAFDYQRYFCGALLPFKKRFFYLSSEHSDNKCFSFCCARFPREFLQKPTRFSREFLWKFTRFPREFLWKQR